MGVYGYGAAGVRIPEGYLRVKIESDDGGYVEQEILFPPNPGSVYHMTKTQDQLLFAYYNKNDEVRVTDLHQGIVWGTQTEETRRDERLINRFDYDGDYGTVLNRFLMQAAIGHPLTVHGTGGQTRAFIHLQDSVRCIELAVENPPEHGERVRIFNQMTETHRLIDLAELVSRLTGAEHRLRREPARRGGRERPLRREPPAPRSRSRADHARGGAPERGRRDRAALRAPLRPRQDPVPVALAQAATRRRGRRALRLEREQSKADGNGAVIGAREQTHAARSVSRLGGPIARRILVTGACGFIGANLVPRLLAAGLEVRGARQPLARQPRQPRRPGRRARRRPTSATSSAVARALDGVDAVVHLAAFGSVAESVEEPFENFDVNVVGTLVLLDACAAAGSGEVRLRLDGRGDRREHSAAGRRGNAPLADLPVRREQGCAGRLTATPTPPRSGLATASLRFANVYGPRLGSQAGRGHDVHHAGARGEPLVIYGDGSATRDFLYVDDLCDGIVRRARALASRTTSSTSPPGWRRPSASWRGWSSS